MQRKLELYVHIPFCVKKCDYCDFLSAPAGRMEQEAYFQALMKEIQASSSLGKDFQVTSVFFGGGTPSLPDARWIVQVMECIKESFWAAPDAEITIEANPGTLTPEKLEAYRACGISRLSLGLQSVRNQELLSLGRIHTFEDFLESWKRVRAAGFSNVNVDLMFGIPDQTMKGWEESLRTVARLGPEHISAYSLIVEEGTPFAKRKLCLPDEDTEYEMYENTAAILREYGYKQYEISNYAREGFVCRHNVGYWKREDYLGLGLGASSFLNGVRFSNTRDMGEYLSLCGQPELLHREVQRITREDGMAEFMFLGLRMTGGISRKEFQESFGCPLEEVYGPVLEKYEKLGLLAGEGDRVFFTREGIHVSNTVMAEFLF
ncbi:MAG: radical SAM family heme chaperone HemW [Clostridiales bacterium]|nr:radical SAM family heme chaperone HemW [Clostridiales bacterium]